MSDRTAAGIFGGVFSILARHDNQADAKTIAAKIWRLMDGYDFAYEELGDEPALKKLDLLRHSDKYDECGDEEMDWGPPKKTRAPRK